MPVVIGRPFDRKFFIARQNLRSSLFIADKSFCSVGKASFVLKELQGDLDVVETRNEVRARMREYADGGVEGRSRAERADDAWRLVQNVLAEEIIELNRGLDTSAQILEHDRLAQPDGSQTIEIVYRDQKFSFQRSKDRLSIVLIDQSAGRLPVETVGTKLFIAGEPIGSAIVAAIGRLVHRATAGIKASRVNRYMALELSTLWASKVEAALNLADENGFRFVESYRTRKPDRRVFLFKRKGPKQA